MISQYFPSYEISKSNNIKVVLDLSGYVREDYLKYFRGKDYIQQNYLVFKPEYKYFKTFADSNLLLFHHGNQKDCLMKKLSQLRYQALIYLLNCVIIMKEYI